MEEAKGEKINGRLSIKAINFLKIEHFSEK